MRGGLAVLDLQGYCIEVWPYPCLTPCLFRSLICCSSQPLPFLGPAHPGPLVPSWGPRGRGQCVPQGRGITDCLLCCRHMVLLKEQYGKQVVVNLLGSRGGEEVLNRAFKVTRFSPWGEAGRGGGGRPAQGGLPWGLEIAACSSMFGEIFFHQSFSIK